MQLFQLEKHFNLSSKLFLARFLNAFIAMKKFQLQVEKHMKMNVYCILNLLERLYINQNLTTVNFVH